MQVIILIINQLWIKRGFKGFDKFKMMIFVLRKYTEMVDWLLEIKEDIQIPYFMPQNQRLE